MAVRAATLADMESLCAMALEFAQMCPWLTADQASIVQTITELLAAPQACVFVAVNRHAEIVGMSAGVVTPAFFCRAHLLAHEVVWYVRPTARQAVYGWALYAALDDWARKQGAQTLTMAALVASRPSVASFLVTRGFVQAETAYVKEL